MAPKEHSNVKIQLLIKALVLILAGMLIGSGLSMRLHGQSSIGYGVSKSLTDPNVIVVATRLQILESNQKDLSNKLDHLQSQADVTEATGVGIGLAITFLQLLGFFTKQKGTV